MTNPFTSLLESANQATLARVNLMCPVWHRVCHDEIDMWVADKAKEDKANPKPDEVSQ